MSKLNENSKISDNILIEELGNKMNTVNQDNEQQENIPNHLNRLPLAKLRRIMKKDPDINLIKKDALFLVSKLTENFIEYMTKELYFSSHMDGRMTIQPKDMSNVVHINPELDFLYYLVPEPEMQNSLTKAKSKQKINSSQKHLSLSTTNKKISTNSISISSDSIQNEASLKSSSINESTVLREQENFKTEKSTDPHVS